MAKFLTKIKNLGGNEGINYLRKLHKNKSPLLIDNFLHEKIMG